MDESNEFSSRMLYSAQLLGYHPLCPMREFGFVGYVEEALESLREATEEEFDKMSDEFKCQLREGMKSLSSYVMQVVYKTLGKLESAALHNMCIPSTVALSEDKVDSRWLSCTDADQRKVEKKLCEVPERLKALKFMNEKLKQELQDLESAQSLLEKRLQTNLAIQEMVRKQGVVSFVESTAYNMQQLEELGDKLKLLQDQTE
ncbi:uncharacterized protein LOC134196677 [Corticium candelabrum]|uniref:uncharacterized protein LOC134196677 n=1 Tax=Corticium candelabrum TaxID=121492 RepID=UPI002E25DD61|nr:uncharacterized protein LOC134196677 [Corticium candelabrum]